MAQKMMFCYYQSFLLTALYVLQEKAVDPKTRLLMYKMVNSGMLETITGCISTGKESVVFHAYGGREMSKIKYHHINKNLAPSP